MANPHFLNSDIKVPAAIQARLSRRQFLKSAALASAVASAPTSLAIATEGKSDADLTADLAPDLSKEPWRTLNSVLEHLLPNSDKGPGARELNILNYFVNVLEYQPIDKEEKTFINNGVGWINGYTQQTYQQDFVTLGFEDKEKSLRTIAKSRAGENWINTLLTYLIEGMLAPAAYGGNPEGLGWKWLSHQAGFPMPDKGKRYYELPAYAKIDISEISDSADSRDTSTTGDSRYSSNENKTAALTNNKPRAVNPVQKKGMA
ncbi:gluconate 2-dehydrogenase subunit 3 family protein [Thalassotalea litorea]|uniref:Gluconate 2-dehydrogenase subunit 3 family protein n=1 Tax=Thalassotalea litorea TaxID=2020715 RepID=A0A5R9IIH0_9GAMM|nr:gluconate 2-dehydrogenase subunit 3 family protein [Thalassotalea litorea]TLU65305.1 gluconate 2-dehydrogenase subunit 3 family protein [Thalassotalea litorea]